MCSVTSTASGGRWAQTSPATDVPSASSTRPTASGDGTTHIWNAATWGGVSDSVLDGVCHALQLDDAERDHLYRLVRAVGTRRPSRRTPVSPVEDCDGLYACCAPTAKECLCGPHGMARALANTKRTPSSAVPEVRS